jgi:ATP-dependent Lhr-like helicase
MLDITREEALRGLVDFGRIEEMLARTSGRIDHLTLPRVTPLAAPLFLEMGRVPVQGDAEERLLAEESRRLMEQSGLAQITPPPSDKPRWRVGF